MASILEDKRVLVAGEITVNCEAFQTLCSLCDDFGSRYFATEEEKKAADFIGSKMRQYGLQNVTVEPYKYFGWSNGKLVELSSWKRGTASLELTGPSTQRIPCLSLAGSPSSLPEGVETEVFVLRSRSRNYLLEHRDEIKGKLVLSIDARDPPDLYRPTVYGYLVEFGAAGFIWSNRNYGGLPKIGSIRFGSMGEIPACGITREGYDQILRYLENSKVVAKLKLQNTIKPGAVSYNVYGDLPGSKYSNEMIFVGGHYDGHDISVGALDDAAGACVVLEAARALAKHAGKLSRTIRFCCFASEELGLNGSSGYVLNHADEMNKIRLMINTDTSGISSKTGHGFTVWEPRELISYLEKLSKSLGSFNSAKEIPFTKAVGSEGKYAHWPLNRIAYSDQFPFFMVGVPVTYFKDIPGDPVDSTYSHTTADTVDKVDPKGLKDAAIILALSLMKIADDENLPFNHVPVEKIVEILENVEIAEDMRMEKRWRRETKV